MIIGLTSPSPRCGKDTCGDFLVDHFDFYKDSFGAGIYQEVSKAFGVTIAQLGTHEWKTTPQPELAIEKCTDPAFRKVVAESQQANPDFTQYQSNTSRFILQQWGTEYRRKEDDQYWVGDLKKRIDPLILNGNPDIVITDVREMHEVSYLYALAAYTGQKIALVEVHRDSALQFKTNHSSDAGIPAEYITHRLHNVEGSPQVMLANLTQIVNTLR